MVLSKRQIPQPASNHLRTRIIHRLQQEKPLHLQKEPKDKAHLRLSLKSTLRKDNKMMLIYLLEYNHLKVLELLFASLLHYLRFILHGEQFSQEEERSATSKLWLSYADHKGFYNFSRVIGKGGFGKVWKVYDKRNKRPYAMKIIDKARVITKKSVQSIMN